jgi:hypothetical protein
VQPVAVIAEKAVGAAIAIAPAAHAVQTQGLGFPSAGSKRSAPFPVVRCPPPKNAPRPRAFCFPALQKYAGLGRTWFGLGAR